MRKGSKSVEVAQFWLASCRGTSSGEMSCQAGARTSNRHISSRRGCPRWVRPKAKDKKKKGKKEPVVEEAVDQSDSEGEPSIDQFEVVLIGRPIGRRRPRSPCPVELTALSTIDWLC